MILLAAIFAVLAAAFAAKAAMLTDGLRVARLELAASKRRPAPPPPSSVQTRQFECRLVRSGLLWYPVLTARDDEKLVVSASSGLPHCARCVCPLKLVSDRTEEWVCSGCGERHGGRAADLMAVDAVLTDCLREFFARHPDYSPELELSAPKFEAAAAA